MARPPTPSNSTAPPSRWRSTFIRPAPRRSPDSSVAIRNILRPTLPVVRARASRQHSPSQIVRPRRRPRSWPAAPPQGYCRRSTAMPASFGSSRALDGARADRRQVVAQVLAGSWAPLPARHGPRLARMRPSARSCAMRASNPSVPSMSSTPTTWPSITTAACPMSNGLSARSTSRPFAMSAQRLRIGPCAGSRSPPASADQGRHP